MPSVDDETEEEHLTNFTEGMPAPQTRIELGPRGLVRRIQYQIVDAVLEHVNNLVAAVDPTSDPSSELVLWSSWRLIKGDVERLHQILQHMSLAGDEGACVDYDSTQPFCLRMDPNSPPPTWSGRAFARMERDRMVLLAFICVLKDVKTFLSQDPRTADSNIVDECKASVANQLPSNQRAEYTVPDTLQAMHSYIVTYMDDPPTEILPIFIRTSIWTDWAPHLMEEEMRDRVVHLRESYRRTMAEENEDWETLSEQIQTATADVAGTNTLDDHSGHPGDVPSDDSNDDGDDFMGHIEQARLAARSRPIAHGMQERIDALNASLERVRGAQHAPSETPAPSTEQRIEEVGLEGSSVGDSPRARVLAAGGLRRSGASRASLRSMYIADRADEFTTFAHRRREGERHTRRDGGEPIAGPSSGDEPEAGQSNTQDDTDRGPIAPLPPRSRQRREI
jgi:hypothetical protein